MHIIEESYLQTFSHSLFYDAMLNDLSAIFGDYTYIFPMQYYRKSTFTSDPDIKTEFIHSQLEIFFEERLERL